MADIIRVLLEVFLCIFLPPLAIFFHGGVCDKHVIVNLILILFVWIPAVIHAFWYCFIRDSNPTI